jgi:apocytochrome f
MYSAEAYPIFAQSAYGIPRENTGRLVCSNCHINQGLVELDVQETVLAGTLFEATVFVPCEQGLLQLTGEGTYGPINLGAVIVLPEGFTIAPKEIISDEICRKTAGNYIQPYSAELPNILVVGPVQSGSGAASRYGSEILFPLISPSLDQGTGTTTPQLLYPLAVGANAGRGQLYPTGDSSNNNPSLSAVSGRVMALTADRRGALNVLLDTAEGENSQSIPNGVSNLVNTGDLLQSGDPISVEPNVGGFGQNESEIVLTGRARRKSLCIFCLATTLAQIALILKKEQYDGLEQDSIDE